MTDQQRDLPLRTGQEHPRQVGLADRGPGHRGGVDGVALAARALALARPGHHVRRHPQHRLTRSEQEPLQRPRDMATILDRPQPLLAMTARELQ